MTKVGRKVLDQSDGTHEAASSSGGFQEVAKLGWTRKKPEVSPPGQAKGCIAGSVSARCYTTPEV